MATEYTTWKQTTVTTPTAPSTTSVFDYDIMFPLYRELVKRDLIEEPMMKKGISSAESFFTGERMIDAGMLLSNLKYGQELIVNIRKDQNPFSLFQKEALEYAHQYGDIAIVSSANRQAVVEEWERYHLLEHVDIILAQDAGTKAHCIRELVKKGYDKEHVLMVGDAPGDCDAAEGNGVHYYPILVNHEKESWDEAIAVAFGKLQSGEYAVYGAEMKQKFLQNLGG